MAKINISIDDELLSKIDKLADENYTSRSGYISMCMAQQVNAKEVISSMSDLSISISKIADTGIVDEKTIKELENFQSITNAFLRKV